MIHDCIQQVNSVINVKTTVIFLQCALFEQDYERSLIVNYPVFLLHAVHNAGEDPGNKSTSQITFEDITYTCDF